MKKTITRVSKTPTKIIQVSGGHQTYEIQSTKQISQIDLTLNTVNMDQKITKFSRKSNRYQTLRKQNKNYKQTFVASCLNTLLYRRMNYSFQKIKLEYMFPDDTFSENISVNSYDRLFFQDQHVHTIVKIHQTIETQAKIWAFLNLKALHTKRKLQKFTNKIEKIQKRISLRNCKNALNYIHQFSINVIPKIKSPQPVTIKTIQPTSSSIINDYHSRKEIKILPAAVKTVVQRKQPINTRIEYKSLQHNGKLYEPAKTQRIQPATIKTQTKIQNTNTNTRNHEVIRIPLGETSPYVTRIQFSPDSNRRLIGTPVKNYTQQSQTNRESRITNIKQAQVKIIRPQVINASNYSTQKRIQYHRPSTYERYQTQTIKNIIYPSPTTITTPATHINTNTHVRTIPNYEIGRSTMNIRVSEPTQSRQINNRYNLYGYGPQGLIHTVHGDVTININNHGTDSRVSDYQSCQHMHKQRHSTADRRCHSERNLSPMHAPCIHINMPNNCSRDFSNSMCGNGCNNCTDMQMSRCAYHHNCCQPNVNHHIHSHCVNRNAYNGDTHSQYGGCTSLCNACCSRCNCQASMYSIEQRIQYMKHLQHLQHMNNMNQNKINKNHSFYQNNSVHLSSKLEDTKCPKE